MNLLIDIGHPAHVHLFRNFIHEMKERGHDIIVTVKDLPAATQLLDLYCIPYIIIGKKGRSIVGKGLSQLKFDLKILSIILKKKVDIGIGSSITIAHVSRLSRMKSIVFDDDDDEVQPLMTKYGHPFASCVVSPDALTGKRKKSDVVYYAGYHELAYLHPSRFMPDPSVLVNSGISPGEKFFILRFNAFKAHHDTGIRGLSMEQKLTLVNYLLKHGKVFITTEKEIEPELESFRLKVAHHRAHSLLYYATAFIGDSQTMTSEAAVLGTPSLRCNSFAGSISYLSEQEDKYGLTFGFMPDNFEGLMARINELLAIPDLREEFHRRRNRMLTDKIDVTAFMVWFVENYPESFKLIRIDSEIQSRFKF
jgi:uncharacterized protein